MYCIGAVFVDELLSRTLPSPSLLSTLFYSILVFVVVCFVVATYRSTDNYAVIAGITSIPVNSWAIRTPTTKKHTCLNLFDFYAN